MNNGVPVCNFRARIIAGTRVKTMQLIPALSDEILELSGFAIDNKRKAV